MFSNLQQPLSTPHHCKAQGVLSVKSHSRRGHQRPNDTRKTQHTNTQTPKMDSEQTDPNLLLLSLNLSDSEPEEAAPPNNTTPSTAGPTSEYQPTRAERTALSEEAFQALKQSYVPKVENGRV